MLHIRLSVAALVLGLLTGCSSTSIYVPVTRPMEINITGLQRIGVALYPSPGDSVWQTPVTPGEMTEAFMRPISEDGRFTPFDLYDYSAELPRKIDASILTKNTVAAFTKITKADAFIFGEILQLSFTQDTLSGRVRRLDRPSGVQVVRKGLMQVRMHIHVVDAASQTMLWDQVVTDEIPFGTSAVNAEPEGIDPVPLAFDAAADISRKMLELTHPIDESVLVTFLQVSGYPDINKGVKFAQQGDWTHALEVFDRLAKEGKGTPDEHKLLYNLGIAYQYSYNFRKAKEAFERAYKLKDSQRYQIAIDDCLKMERSYLELVKQK